MTLPGPRFNRSSPIRRQGWWIVIAALALLAAFSPLPLPAAAPAERRMRIEAGMSQYSPSEWAVNPGDRVTVELVATDVEHGFSLDNYNFALAAKPGQTVSGTFIADKSGVFRFRCSIPCGNLHPFMIGELRVGPNLLLIRGLALGTLAVAAAILSFHMSASRPSWTVQ